MIRAAVKLIRWASVTGGGGTSEVRTQPRTVPLATTDSRLIVASGGGGSGVGSLCGGTGDRGGDAIGPQSDGGDGESCPSLLGGTGGRREARARADHVPANPHRAKKTRRMIFFGPGTAPDK